MFQQRQSISTGRRRFWAWLCKHVSPTNRVAVLLAWAAIHTTVIWALLYALDTDVARGYKRAGLQATAVQLLLVLLSCNTCLYLSIWASDPGYVRLQDTTHQQQRQKGLQRQRSPDEDQHWQLSTQPHADAAHYTSMHAKLGHTGRACQRRDSSGGGSSCSTDSGERLLAHEFGGDVEVAAATHQREIAIQCRHCGVVRPLRSRHCRHCARCVRGFDHHCFWVGTCIGAHNHARFWAFLGTQTAILAFGVHEALTALRHQAQDPAALGWRNRQQLLAAALTMFQMLVFLVVGGLLFLHSLLMVLNLTTFEAFERRRVPYLADVPTGVSLFDKGPVHNVLHFFCARELYDTPVDWHKQQVAWQAMSVTVLVDNEWYSCC